MSTKINVRFIHTCEDHPPLMREFKFAEILTKPGTGNEKGRRFRWLYWYWKPESEKAYDCGFSGIREDHPKFNQLKARLIK